ncbi:MAG: hypothetical protein QME32_07475 [Endomicrobiia bacterium]|nr:hypothetical protein [Endomicrobiia bacterium]
MRNIAALRWALALLCFLRAQPLEALVFELVKTGVETIGKGVDTISDEVFKKTMVAKTVENVAELQKNFDESKRFYDEVRMIQQNPATLSDYARDESIRRLRRSKDYAVHRGEMDYRKHYSKPGYIGKAFEQADEYVRTNLDFSDAARVAIRDKQNVYENVVSSLPKKGESGEAARQKAENARLQNDLLQTEILIEMLKNNTETNRALTRLYEKMTEGDSRAKDRQDAWLKGIEGLSRDLSDKKTGRYKSSKEVLDELLRK